MKNATIYEVLQFAINMEEEGIKFYKKWAAGKQFLNLIIVAG